MGRFDNILVRKEKIEEKSFDTQIYLQQTYKQKTCILVVLADSLKKMNKHLPYFCSLFFNYQKSHEIDAQSY